MLHQDIPAEISIILGLKFLQKAEDIKNFRWSIHYICENVLIYSQGQTKTSFLDKNLKNNCSKADCKTTKIKTIVKQISLKANKNYFANRPNQGLAKCPIIISCPTFFVLESSLCIQANSCRKGKGSLRLYFTRQLFQILHFFEPKVSQLWHRTPITTKEFIKLFFPRHDQTIATS